MSAPAPPPIDIVSVMIALAGLIFGHDLAMVVGPYAVVLMGATLGATLSAARMEPGQGMSTLAHMLLFITLALLMTVPGAYLLEQQFSFEGKWTLGPVAVLIAGIGQDWPVLVRWAIEQARGFIERWVSKKGEQP